MTPYAQVREFRRAFGQSCPDFPERPDDSTINTCYELIAEEHDEFGDATNTLEAFDAILDMLYVVYGAAIAYGFTEEQIKRGFDEVHRSNMSKMWNALEVDSEHFLKGFTARMVYASEGRRYVVTNESGKIIKPPSYSPASLGPILEGKV